MNPDEIKAIIDAISEVFVVICGVAVTQFFLGGTVIDTDPIFQDNNPKGRDCRMPPERPKWEAFSTEWWWYWISYILALIILVTVVLRFLIGSHKDLVDQYKTINAENFGRFVADVSFLMFFGAFLVGAALSKTVRSFMGWLAVISGTGVTWSLMALSREDRALPYWWLTVNGIQLALTSLLFRRCRFSGEKAKNQKAVGFSLVIAGVIFMGIFWLDLQKITLGKIVPW